MLLKGGLIGEGAKLRGGLEREFTVNNEVLTPVYQCICGKRASVVQGSMILRRKKERIMKNENFSYTFTLKLALGGFPEIVSIIARVAFQK